MLLTLLNIENSSLKYHKLQICWVGHAISIHWTNNYSSHCTVLKFLFLGSECKGRHPALCDLCFAIISLTYLSHVSYELNVQFFFWFLLDFCLFVLLEHTLDTLCHRIRNLCLRSGLCQSWMIYLQCSSFSFLYACFYFFKQWWNLQCKPICTSFLAWNFVIIIKMFYKSGSFSNWEIKCKI